MRLLRYGGREQYEVKLFLWDFVQSTVNIRDIYRIVHTPSTSVVHWFVPQNMLSEMMFSEHSSSGPCTAKFMPQSGISGRTQPLYTNVLPECHYLSKFGPSRQIWAPRFSFSPISLWERAFTQSK